MARIPFVCLLIMLTAPVSLADTPPNIVHDLDKAYCHGFIAGTVVLRLATPGYDVFTKCHVNSIAKSEVDRFVVSLFMNFLDPGFKLSEVLHSAAAECLKEVIDGTIKVIESTSKAATVCKIKHVEEVIEPIKLPFTLAGQVVQAIIDSKKEYEEKKKTNMEEVEKALKNLREGYGGYADLLKTQAQLAKDLKKKKDEAANKAIEEYGIPCPAGASCLEEAHCPGGRCTGPWNMGHCKCGACVESVACETSLDCGGLFNSCQSGGCRCLQTWANMVGDSWATVCLYKRGWAQCHGQAQYRGRCECPSDEDEEM